CGDTRVLIDAGVGPRRVAQALSEAGLQVENLDAILVTHEHTDHVKGLRTVAKRFNAPIYTSAGTWNAIAGMWQDNEAVVARRVTAGTPFALGSLVIEPFSLPHDANEPTGFCLYAGRVKLAIATDLGYVNDRIRAAVAGADMLVLETNHDVELLRAGSYPWHLKRRILGDEGHLSNEAGAQMLVDVLDERVQTVCLAHLSQDNNRPELARKAVDTMLSQVSGAIRERLRVHVAGPLHPTPVFTLHSRP
ncbi:MAG: MBL fold metallo-hydrolase, partial [Firmicutes bacterium]|nr:MBL fold metallo-hydrolase [Bacillota bacterium]